MRRLEHAYAAACRRSARWSTTSDSDSSARVASAKAAGYDQRRKYGQLRRRRMCTTFWHDKIDAVDYGSQLMFCLAVVACQRTLLSTQNHLIDSSSRRLPGFAQTLPMRHRRLSSPPRSAASFTDFTPLTAGDVVKAVRQLPDKFSAADPLSTSTLKQAVDLLAPFIVEVFNRSLVRGHFPAAFKKAFITPTLKKPGIDGYNGRLVIPADLEPASVVEIPRAPRYPAAHRLPTIR